MDFEFDQIPFLLLLEMSVVLLLYCNMMPPLKVYTDLTDVADLVPASCKLSQ